MTPSSSSAGLVWAHAVPLPVPDARIRAACALTGWGRCLIEALRWRMRLQPSAIVVVTPAPKCGGGKGSTDTAIKPEMHTAPIWNSNVP
eukprot:1765529-Pyramimonas_sp.AAC.1